MKLEIADAGRLQRLGVATVGLIYAQVFFGAVLRHTGAMLDMHLVFAFLASLHVILVGLRIFRRHLDQPALFRPALWLCGLLSIQLGLGLGAYLGKFVMTLPETVTVLLRTGHVVVGALMLATGLVVTLRSFGLLAQSGPAGEGIAAAIALGSGPGRASA